MVICMKSRDNKFFDEFLNVFRFMVLCVILGFVMKVSEVIICKQLIICIQFEDYFFVGFRIGSIIFIIFFIYFFGDVFGVFCDYIMQVIMVKVELRSLNVVVKGSEISDC